MRAHILIFDCTEQISTISNVEQTKMETVELSRITLFVNLASSA